VAGKPEATPGAFDRAAAGKQQSGDNVGGSGLTMLSQADVAVENNATQIGLQALDLFFNNDWRLYVRSTLPVSQPDAGSSHNPSSTPSASSQSSQLTDAQISSLLDPYGGTLNLAGGFYNKIPFAMPDDVDHGLFVDVRLGLKLLTLPGQSSSAPTVLTTTVTPFYSGVAILKFLHNVFNDAPGKHIAGGFEFDVGYVVNVTADKAASSVFAMGVLDQTTQAVRFDMALNLTSIAAIGISWNPWSSNSTFGQHFVISLKLLNQNPVAKPS
jgi:hypothetical protein